MEPKRYKRRKRWFPDDEKNLFAVWTEYLDKLKGVKKNRHILLEMSKAPQFKGRFTPSEIIIKINNLTKRYRIEKRRMALMDEHTSDWHLYDDVHKIIGTFEIIDNNHNKDYRIEESIDAIDKLDQVKAFIYQGKNDVFEIDYLDEDSLHTHTISSSAKSRSRSSSTIASVSELDSTKDEFEGKILTDKVGKIKNVDYQILKLDNYCKSQKEWQPCEEQNLLALWAKYIDTYRELNQNEYILSVMAVQLGGAVTPSEVKLKLQNLTNRFRLERAKIGLSDELTSHWPLYDEVHKIIGTFNLNYLKKNRIEESIETLDDVEPSETFEISRKDNESSMLLHSTSTSCDPTQSSPAQSVSEADISKNEPEEKTLRESKTPDEIETIKNTDDDILKSQSTYKPRKVWRPSEENKLVTLWGKYIDTLKGVKKNRHVMIEIAKQLGDNIAPCEVQVKLHNWTNRYRSEKKKVELLGTTDWPLFNDVHKIIEILKMDDTKENNVEENTKTLDEQSVDDVKPCKSNLDKLVQINAVEENIDMPNQTISLSVNSTTRSCSPTVSISEFESFINNGEQEKKNDLTSINSFQIKINELIETDKNDGIKYVDENYLKNLIKRKPRKLWRPIEEKNLLTIWFKYVNALRGLKKNRHIIVEMANELGVAPYELQVKLQNLTRRYRLEKRSMELAEKSTSDWDLYDDVHKIIGSFEVDDTNNSIGEKDDPLGYSDDEPESPMEDELDGKTIEESNVTKDFQDDELDSKTIEQSNATKDYQDAILHKFTEVTDKIDQIKNIDQEMLKLQTRLVETQEERTALMRRYLDRTENFYDKLLTFFDRN